MADMQKVWVCSIVGDDKLEDYVLVGAQGNVADVRLAVKAHMSNTLRHCDAVDLEVFQKQDGKEIALNIRDAIPKDTKENPLIIKVKEGTQQRGSAGTL
jgi:hypothetical protein